MKAKEKLLSWTTLVVVLLVVLFGCGSDDEPAPKAPFITSFSPQIGEAGNVVTITGGNFISPVVYINKLKAEFTGSKSETILEILVPTGVTTGKIRVETSAGSVESEDEFQVIGLPAITSFSPEGGVSGDEVVITGQNFTESTKVIFSENRQASIISKTENQLVVVIPENATPGVITVTTGAGSATSATSFIANPHTITTVVSELNSLPLTITGPGHRILINGTNFSNNTQVRLGDKELQIVYSLPTQILAIMPSGITSGKISVTRGSHTVEFDETIEVPSGEWKRLEDFPESRPSGKVFVINGKAYYGGSPSGSERKDFWKFDPSDNSWASIAEIGGITSNDVAFSVNNRGYVGSSQGFWEYNPNDDEWAQKGNAAFFTGKAVALNGKAYVLEDLNTTAFYEYDPDLDSWTSKAAFPLTSLRNPAVFTLNNKVYVVGGITDASAKTMTVEMYEYDPSTDVWTQKADFPGKPRGYANAFSLNGSAYVGGGYDYATTMTYEDVWRYDAAQDKWFPSVPHPGYFNNAFVIGDKAYSGLYGGSTNGSKFFYEFTP